MRNMLPGAISDLKLKEIETVLSELSADQALDIRELVERAREIQKTCTHEGWLATASIWNVAPVERT